MLSKEVTRLRDKDVRQRRKAVRRLFEDGDPSALPHFLPFLNDQDDWFVERAMIAIERWYDGRDEGIVQSLAKSEIPDRRLLAARVANRLGSPKGILGILAQDDDLKVRIAAWKGLMGLDPSESTPLESTDAAVRRIAVNSSSGLGRRSRVARNDVGPSFIGARGGLEEHGEQGYRCLRQGCVRGIRGDPYEGRGSLQGNH